jgi:predicted RND superfamily exporter protein
MALVGISININTLPLVTVGLGFGIDYGLYILSRTIEEIQVRGDLEESMREAMVTTGKAVSFTAVCMVFSTAAWAFSNIAFNAIMGVMLAGWMLISFLAGVSLLPVMVIALRPKFIMKEANTKNPNVATARAAAAS